MVTSFFKNKEIQTKVGFSVMPNIVHMDAFASNVEDQFHFEFAGGSRCSLQKHCYANVKINRAESKYEGQLFDYDYQQVKSGSQLFPIVTFHAPKA